MMTMAAAGYALRKIAFGVGRHLLGTRADAARQLQKVSLRQRPCSCRKQRRKGVEGLRRKEETLTGRYDAFVSSFACGEEDLLCLATLGRGAARVNVEREVQRRTMERLRGWYNFIRPERH